MPAPLLRLLRLHDATPAERAATAWTAVAFFCVLFAYYLLRPLRENVGHAFGQDQLLWLFVLTFVLVTLINQPYVALVRRLPSHRFLPYGLHAFAASFVVLAAVFGAVDTGFVKLSWARWDGRLLALFYSWVTAFSVCGVTLVWVHAVEWFTTAQGKRLFGLVSVGGTLGAMAGSSASLHLAQWNYSWLLLLGAATIELAVLAWWLSLHACRRMEVAPRLHALAAGPGYLEGIARVVREPYLRAMAAFVLPSAVIATTFYYQRIAIVSAGLADGGGRRAIEADINWWYNALCLVVQLFFTSRALLAFGVAVVLCVMPVASLGGLVVISVWPLVSVCAVVEVVRRMLQFAFDKPAREVVYTPLDPEAKYVSKAVIDTSVLRLGDVLGACANALLLRANASNALLLWCSAPLLVAWGAVGVWLGRACQRRERAQREPA